MKICFSVKEPYPFPKFLPYYKTIFSIISPPWLLFNFFGGGECKSSTIFITSFHNHPLILPSVNFCCQSIPIFRMWAYIFSVMSAYHCWTTSALFGYSISLKRQNLMDLNLRLWNYWPIYFERCRQWKLVLFLSFLRLLL